MRRSLLLVLPLTMLAACSSGDQDPAPPEPSFAPTSVPTSTATPAPAASAAGEAAARIIPARFHGVWDWPEGTCDLASDMRMEVNADDILFYESLGTLTSVVDADGAATVALAMEGEGETWSETMVMRLVEDDTMLEVTYPSANSTTRRKRCS